VIVTLGLFLGTAIGIGIFWWARIKLRHWVPVDSDLMKTIPYTQHPRTKRRDSLKPRVSPLSYTQYLDFLRSAAERERKRSALKFWSYLEGGSHNGLGDAQMARNKLCRASSPNSTKYLETLECVSRTLSQRKVQYVMIKLPLDLSRYVASDIDIMPANLEEMHGAMQALEELGYRGYRLNVDRDPLKVTMYRGAPTTDFGIDFYSSIEIERLHLLRRIILDQSDIFSETAKRRDGIPVPTVRYDCIINIVHDFGHRTIPFSSFAKVLYGLDAFSKEDWSALIALCLARSIASPTFFYLSLVDAFGLMTLRKPVVPEWVVSEFLKFGPCRHAYNEVLDVCREGLDFPVSYPLAVVAKDMFNFL
jgi:hypothetical protein